MFSLVQTGDIKYMSIPAFANTGLVRHAFTTRGGGVSPAPYATLNMGFHTGDDREHVWENRRRICQVTGVDPAGVVTGQQVHGGNVAIVSRSDRGKGAFCLEDSLPDTDALITAVPEVPLMGCFADCTSIFLLDPVQKVIGLAHAGWKGTVLKIAAATVLKMTEAFRSKPQDLLAGIGPSIGPCCYEVDQPVVTRLQEAIPDSGNLVVPGTPGKWHLDLPGINRKILKDAGIPEDQITVCRVCTRCNTDLFFSYRAENGVTGRMGALIMLV